MSPRSWLASLVLVLASCASRAEAPTVAPTKTRQPGPHAAPDDDRVEIAGRVLAHDGAPLVRAAVTVRREGFETAMATEVLDDHGRFRVSVVPGAYSISIAAVDHRRVLRHTVVTDDLRVEGRLGTLPRLEPDEELRLRGDYLDGEGQVLGRAPGSATRVAEGRYRLDLSSKVAGAVRLRYQVVDPEHGVAINGPVADDFEYDGDGGFWSVVDVSTRDVLHLDLDPSARPPSVEPELEWAGEDPVTAEVHAFKERWYAAIGELHDRYPARDGATEQRDARQKALAAKAREEIDAKADTTVQAMLRTAYLPMFGMDQGIVGDGPRLREELGWIVEHLPPADPRLALLPTLDNLVFRAREGADEAFVAQTEAWLERRARHNPEPLVALQALELLLHDADERHDEARIEELYAMVVDPRFDGTFAQTRLRQRFDPDRILQRGQPFPAFDFAALRDGDPRVTHTDRVGRLYLLEFWATWCSPCVAEMPELHATYAAINGAPLGKRGQRRKVGVRDPVAEEDERLRRLSPVEDPRIEFVFVSLDAGPSEVEAFRREQWSMPWTHAFVGQAGEEETMARYGFSSVPTPVLVDEDGVILEVGMALRRDQLRPTLERVLAERGGPRADP